MAGGENEIIGNTNSPADVAEDQAKELIKNDLQKLEGSEISDDIKQLIFDWIKQESKGWNENADWPRDTEGNILPKSMHIAGLFEGMGDFYLGRHPAENTKFQADRAAQWPLVFNNSFNELFEWGISQTKDGSEDRKRIETIKQRFTEIISKESPAADLRSASDEAAKEVTPIPGITDREDASTKPAESLLSKFDVSLESKKIDAKRFSPLLAEIENVNKTVKGLTEKISIFVEDGKTLVIRGLNNELKIPIEAENFEDQLYDSIQKVLGEYSGKMEVKNEYTKMADDLAGQKDPVSNFIRVLLLWASKYPGIADSLFYGDGFVDKVRKGSYKTSKFEDAEASAIKATRQAKDMPVEEKNAVAAAIPANYDSVRASINYVQKILWPDGQFAYSGAAALASKLQNSGEIVDKNYEYYYDAYQEGDDGMAKFKESPPENSVLFFQYGETSGNAMMQGFEKLIALSSFVSRDDEAKEENKPDLFVGCIKNGQLEFLMEGKVTQIPLTDPKLKIMLAYTETDFLKEKKKTDDEKSEDQKEKKLEEDKKKEKEESDKKEKEIHDLEIEIADLKKMVELSTRISTIRSGKSADQLAQLPPIDALNLKQSEAELEKLAAKYTEYIGLVAEERPAYIANKVAELESKKKELKDAKSALSEGEK